MGTPQFSIQTNKVQQCMPFELNFWGKPLLQGYRDETGLWCIPLIAPKQSKHEHTLINDKRFHQHAIHNIYELPSTEKIIRFLHAALGFPPKSTLLKAIHNGHLNMFPGHPASNVNKFFPESDKTQKGHMSKTDKA